jgi:hypothetical protein
MMMSGNAGRGLKGEESIFRGFQLGDLKSVRAERKLAGSGDGVCRGARYDPRNKTAAGEYNRVLVSSVRRGCVFEKSHVSSPRDEEGF